jgi:hypothetical protein
MRCVIQVTYYAPECEPRRDYLAGIVSHNGRELVGDMSQAKEYATYDLAFADVNRLVDRYPIPMDRNKPFIRFAVVVSEKFVQFPLGGFTAPDMSKTYFRKNFPEFRF